MFVELEVLTVGPHTIGSLALNLRAAIDAGQNTGRREDNTWIAQMSGRVNTLQLAEGQLRKW